MSNFVQVQFKMWNQDLAEQLCGHINSSYVHYFSSSLTQATSNNHFTFKFKSTAHLIKSSGIAGFQLFWKPVDLKHLQLTKAMVTTGHTLFSPTTVYEVYFAVIYSSPVKD